MPIVSGGGGGASLAPPVTLTGTNGNPDVLSVIGAPAHVGTIFTAYAPVTNAGLEIDSNGAGGVSNASLTTDTGSLSFRGHTNIGIDTVTDYVQFTGALGALFFQNAVQPDGGVFASSWTFWLDDTPAATKLMIKAKDSAGTVRTAAIALA
jgi:hypothetical protein